MTRLTSIAFNAFMELVRQPVFLLLMTFSAGFCVFLSSVPYFAFGEDLRMVMDTTYAVTLVSGVFGAVISASASVAHEIRSGTALAVLSKPVGRAQFLLAKYAGLAGALALLTYANLIGVLLASRMGFDAYGDADTKGLATYFGLIALGYALAGLSNYFLRRPFVADAVFLVTTMATVAFLIIVFVMPEHKNTAYGATGVQWPQVQGVLLILFALWILAAIALACSTRFELIPTLAICSVIFLLGMMSDYLFGRAAEEGSFIAQTLYTLLPNWQLFWISDALGTGHTAPFAYIGKAAAYMVGYLGAALAVALILFEDRDLT